MLHRWLGSDWIILETCTKNMSCFHFLSFAVCDNTHVRRLCHSQETVWNECVYTTVISTYITTECRVSIISISHVRPRPSVRSFIRSFITTLYCYNYRLTAVMSLCPFADPDFKYFYNNDVLLFHSAPPL